MNTELTIASKKEKLVKDLRIVVADADDLLQQVAGSTAEEFATARSQIESRLGEARSRLDDARHTVIDGARYAADATHEYVRENPWKTLGVGAVAGLIAAFLLSRR